MNESGLYARVGNQILTKGWGASYLSGCMGSIFSDELDFYNASNWSTYSDSSNISSFADGLFKLDNIVASKQAYIWSWNADPFKIDGALDVCFGFQLDSIGYSAGSWTTTPQHSFVMNKSGNHMTISLKMDGPSDPNPGKMYYQMWDNTGPVNWRNMPAGNDGVSYHAFRITKPAGAGVKMTAYAWNPILSRWEWDGNTNGVEGGDTFGTTDIDRFQFKLATTGNVDNYLLGGYDYFRVNVGNMIWL